MVQWVREAREALQRHVQLQMRTLQTCQILRAEEAPAPAPLLLAVHMPVRGLEWLRVHDHMEEREEKGEWTLLVLSSE